MQEISYTIHLNFGNLSLPIYTWIYAGSEFLTVMISIVSTECFSLIYTWVYKRVVNLIST